MSSAGRSARRVPLHFFQNFGGSQIQSGSGGTGVGARGGDIASHNTLNLYLNEQLDKQALDVLEQRIAPGAFHNSAERFDPPKCHPHTREAVVKEILDWVDSDNLVHPLLWMYGPAGTGKSSIAQTIAEMLHKKGKLAASFFFSRTAEGRNDNTRFVATIAYQLALVLPALKVPMANAIQNDRTVFSRSLEAQIDILVLNPLLDISRPPGTGKPSKESASRYPGLVIVDGLDECGSAESQRQVLLALLRAIQRSNASLFFLIASRPEFEIRNFFNRPEVHFLSRPLVLDDRYQPDKDIRTFLLSTFDDIKNDHPSGPSLSSDWPRQSDVWTLVKKASGQFVYVSTVMKFISDPRKSPVSQLQIALQLVPPKDDLPFASLDALYARILGSVHNMERVKEILTFLILRESLFDSQLDTINALLHLEEGELQILLIDLHSVMDVPPAGEGSESVHLYHASLGDFLLDKSRSGNFFINERDGHAEIARNCMRVLMDAIHDHMQWYKPAVFLGSCAFLLPSLGRHCPSLENLMIPDAFFPSHSCLIRTLKDDLYNFDIAAFLDLPFGKKKDVIDQDLREIIFSDFHYLQLWIQHHDDQADLYRYNEEQCDRFLVGRFGKFAAPAVFHVLAAMTILNTEQIREFFRLLDLGNIIPGYSLADYEEFDFTHLWGQVTEFIKDFNRSGLYYINAFRYKEFVKFCLRILDVPQFHDPRAQMPNWPSWLGDTNLQVCESEELCLDLISAAISRIPLDREFADYLRHHPIPEESKYNVEESRQLTLHATRTYIEV